MADEEKLEREDSEQEVEGQSQQMGEELQPEQTGSPFARFDRADVTARTA